MKRLYVQFINWSALYKCVRPWTHHCTGKAGHAWRIWWLGKDDSFVRIWPSIHKLFISFPLRLFEGRDIEQLRIFFPLSILCSPPKSSCFWDDFTLFFLQKMGSTLCWSFLLPKMIINQIVQNCWSVFSGFVNTF